MQFKITGRVMCLAGPQFSIPPGMHKERVSAISAHFITAFPDDYVKGDGSRAAHLPVLVTEPPTLKISPR
jgi:hypothetical protein